MLQNPERYVFYFGFFNKSIGLTLLAFFADDNADKYIVIIPSTADNIIGYIDTYEFWLAPPFSMRYALMNPSILPSMTPLTSLVW